MAIRTVGSRSDLDKQKQRMETVRLSPGRYQTLDRKYLIIKVRDDLWKCVEAETNQRLGQAMWKKGRYIFGCNFESKRDWIRHLTYNETTLITRREFDHKYSKKKTP